ncbi:MAG: Hsp70 family protein [Kofleriaceae bacterium]
MTDPIVGIDLGTSNSVVAYADAGGNVRVLADESGGKIHPSVVSFHPNGGVVVGAGAKQRKVIDPQNTIYSVKRLIGRAYSSHEVRTAKKRMPYQIKEGENELPLIVTRGGEFAVPEISAIVLDHVRNIATAQLGREVSRAVVTVPASFNDAQRSATATAGAIAGITVVRVLNEPTAAALAYGNTRNLKQTIAVYDFGGGTFDITILRLNDQVYEVLGTAGDTFLGGDDLDERLVDKMVAKFLSENRIDLRTNEISMMRLRAVAEQTKIELSRRSRAVVRVDEIAYGPNGRPLNLQIEITRDEFVSNVADIIDKTFPVCREAMSYAGLSVDKIDDIILVGGTTKIPYVRDQVSKFFSKAPRTDVNAEDAVAVGAALQATSLERILSRSGRTSAQVPKIDPPEEKTATDAIKTLNDRGVTMQSFTDLSSPPVLEERPKRTTANYGAEKKVDTAYSVSRAGTREVFEGKTPPGGQQPIGRLRNAPQPQTTQPLHRVDVQPPRQTAFGVPVAPVPSSFLAPEETTQAEPLAIPTPPSGLPMPPKPPLIPKPPTNRGMGALTPPPIPALRQSTPIPVVDEPSSPAAIEWGSPDDFQTKPGGQDPEPSPASTNPTFPPVAPPTAPTMMSMVPPVRPVAPPSQPPPSYPPASSAPSMPSAPSYPSSGQPFGPSGQPTPFGPPPAPPNARTLVPSAPPPASSARAIDPRTPSGSAARSSFDELAAPRPPAYQPPNVAATLLELESEQTDLGAVPSSSASTARGFTPPPQAPAPQAYPVMPRAQAPSVPPKPAPVVMDVTPRSLGIATVAGYCEELIRRNSRVPAQMVKVFSTSRDLQKAVHIVVCQGESRRLENNTIIGDLHLEGLTPRPRGETSIEVTFSLDASGILRVKARDAQTGREQQASLDLVGGVREENVAASREKLQQLRR